MSVLPLKKLGRAKTPDSTMTHDCDSVSKEIGLIHVVSRQDNDPVLLVVLEHVPKSSSRVEVHPAGWLIKDDKLESATNAKATLSFLLFPPDKLAA